MDLKNDTDRKRLAEAMRYSRKVLSGFRAKRRRATATYVGSNYGEEGTTKAQILNLIALGVDIFTRHLAARAPRVLTSTKQRMYRQAAARAELRGNALADELELQVLFAQVAKEAMFSVGIVKTGMASGEQVEVDDETFTLGRPFADVIGLDDWVHDCTAPEFRKKQFAGNLYYPRIDCLADEGTFKGGVIDKLRNNEMVASRVGEDRADSVGHGRLPDDAVFAPRTALWHIHLPYEKTLATFMADTTTGELLYHEGMIDQREYEGPDGGPFDMLGFRSVPGNIMPLPPVAQMFDMHEAANKALRKLTRRADAEKDIIAAQMNAREDAQKVKDAPDLEILALANPQGINQLHFGGVNNMTMAWTMWLKDLFIYTNGNLDMLGGLGAMSETLGQDQMLMATASKQVQEMQDRMIGFARTIMRKLMWWDWQDPLTEQQLVKTLKSTGEPLTIVLTPEDRQKVDMLDLNIEVHPYSMQHQSPGERLQTIGMVWERYILPSMETMMQQGIVPNFDGLLRLIGKHANLPEIEDILTFSAASTLPEAGARTPQSPVTTRNTVRTNRSMQNTPQGRQTQMMQRLLGSGTGAGDQG